MDFAHPGILWLLTLTPVLALLAWTGRRRRARDWAGLAQSGRPPDDGSLAWIGVVACLAVALARPRWGREPAPPLPPGHDVVFLVDTSRSMGAEDAVPNRLGAAVEAADGLLTALGLEGGDRAAVVAFAGRGVVRCPLTENLGAVAEALRALRPAAVRPGGTDLGAALDAAARAFDEQEHAQGRTVVLFSDGEDHAGTWAAASSRLRAAGVMVHAIALGDPERGHPVPSGSPGRGLTWRAQPVLSRRWDGPLEAVAQATGGALVRSGLAPLDLGTLYRERIEPVARERRAVVRLPVRKERYPVFVLAALGCSMLGCWLGGRAWPWPRGLAVVGTLAALGAAAGDESPRAAIDAGRSAYAVARFAEALADFERAIALDARGAVPRFDAASALYRLGRFPAARERYREARERAGPALRTMVDYALGNTALALGDVAAALRHYDDCLASTARGADLDAVRRDAAINRRFAEERTRQGPSTPPAPGGGTSPRPDRPRGKTASDAGRSGGESPPGTSAPDAGSPDAPPSGHRATGGAGGTGPAPRHVRPPEERLAAALEDIRQARRRRLADEPPPDAEGAGKNW